MDLATLGFRVETGSLKSASADLDSFGAKAKSTADAINQGTTSAKGATTATSAYAAAMGAASSSASAATRDLGKLSEVAGVLEARAVGMASNFGIMGSMLTVLGPIGIGVAAGLGAAVVAAYELAASANRMGDFANNLSNVAQTAGITTTQLQALQIAGSQVGVSATTIEMGFNLFTVSVEQLRQGIGPLYVELEKISPSLVRQLSATHDTATAWNLLAQAYKNADQEQRNIIARAAGGRGGIELGRVLLSTADAGGIDGQVAGMNQLDLITRQQIESWKALKNAIDEETKLAKDNIASIFTGDVLGLEKDYADIILDISRALKSIESSGSTVKAVFGTIADSVIAAIPGLNTLHEALVLYRAVHGLVSTPAPAATAPSSFDVNANTGGVSGAIPGSAPILGAGLPAGPTPQVLASQWALYVAALGPAATIQDRLAASLAKLNGDLADGKFKLDGTIDSLAAYNRAVSAVKLDAQIQNATPFVGALGTPATAKQIADGELRRAA